MLDVHAPNTSISGWREFLLHLITITIGLLIALSLEGWVDWLHHRHLLHDAEANLKTEIKSNAEGVSDAASGIHKQQEALKHDVSLLNQIISGHKLPKDSNMSVDLKIISFDNLSWRTAQSTGALSYMSYDEAKEYAEIYDTQESFEAAEKQAGRDAVLSLAPFMNLSDKDPDPSKEEAMYMKQQIEALQGQLLLVDAVVGQLDQEYKKFIAAHPD
jgi:hypothetical protein